MERDWRTQHSRSLRRQLPERLRPLLPMAALPALGVTICFTTLLAMAWRRLPSMTVPLFPGSRH